MAEEISVNRKNMQSSFENFVSDIIVHSIIMDAMIMKNAIQRRLEALLSINGVKNTSTTNNIINAKTNIISLFFISQHLSSYCPNTLLAQ